MQKRIVVLGGVGFIGTHLCLRLLDEGHEVFCVDTRDIANSPLLRDMPPHPEFRYVRHNIVNAFGIRCDEIYNLAAPSRVRYNKALPVESLKVSILGSINALDTARSEHARILYASTGDIYGTGYRDTSVEAADGCPTHRTLAEGKRAGEAQHRAYQCGGRQGYGDDEGDGTLLLQEVEVALGTGALKAGGQDGADAVHRAAQQHEDVEFLAFEVDGRQHHIVVDGGEYQRHRQIQQCAAQRCAHGLMFLFGAGLAGKALKVGVVPVCVHRQFLSVFWHFKDIIPDGGGFV